MSRKLSKFRADPAQCAHLFSELFPVTEDEQPVEVFAYQDAKKVIRRAVARYESGWTVRLNFDRQGYLTTRSATLKLTTEPQKAAA